MVVGTLSLVQKGQTRGCSMQYIACSGIVVYGGGDIIFWCKKVKPVDAVCSMQWNSGVWWWVNCSLVQKGQTSGRTMQWMH